MVILVGCRIVKKKKETNKCQPLFSNRIFPAEYLSEKVDGFFRVHGCWGTVPFRCGVSSRRKL